MGSVKEEITRLETAKKDIETAIETCGVNVPDTELIDTYASYIRQIPSAVFSGLNVDPVGGADQFIQSIKQTNGLIEATVGGLVSTSNSGLVPKADGSAGVINNQSDDYVLTYKGGTVDWYKLPANAFKNDDNNTTYTLSGALNGNAYDVTLTPSSGSATGAKVPAMGAASSSAAGTAGLVPAPAKNKHNSFLRGDGTWAVPDNTTYSVMTGATASAAGKSGLVPQPAKGDQGKFLSGAGTWTALPSLSITDSESGNAVTDVEVSGHGITLKRGTTFSVNGHKHSSDDITALTSYIKATTVAAIASTDSLNTALGKLEYKTDVAYNLVKGAYDGDGTIENLAEILKVLEGISDTDTIQAIIGKYLPLAGGTMTGNILLGGGNAIIGSGNSIPSKFLDSAGIIPEVPSVWIAAVGDNGSGGTGGEASGILFDGNTIKMWSPLDNAPQIIDSDNGTAYNLLHSGNSSVSKSGETLTVKINGTEHSLTNTWPTKSNLGLENVDNTADANKSVKYATTAGSVAWNNVSDKPSLSYVYNGITSSTGTKYYKLGSLPSSSTLTYDSFIIRGTVGGWVSSYKSHIDISVGRREYVTFRGLIQRKISSEWDIAVNSAGEIVLILYDQYTAWSLELHTLQGTIDCKSFTPSDTNFTYVSNSSSIVVIGTDGYVAKAVYATSAGYADSASYIHYANIGGGTSDTHDSVLKTYFNNNKTSIPRDSLLGMYSGAYGNGSYYMGYWLSGYDTKPYGGFFVAHYNNPYYVGISNGTYTTQAILTSTNYTNYTVQKDGTGATGTWGINISGIAASASNVAWGNVSGKPTTFTPSTHTHTSIVTEGDNRAVATKPTDYSNNFVFRGLKNNSTLGIPTANGNYSYLVGLRGWSDKSGGGTHELAFNDGGIFRRSSTSSADTWESWRTILDSDNWTSFISIPSVGNGTVTINQAGASKGSFTLNQSTTATIDLTDTNYYPTAFSWTGGTTAGPTGSLTGTGMSPVSFGAIPAATGSASGIVTTSFQTFAGEKTFHQIRLRQPSTSGSVNYGGYLYFGDGSYAYIAELSDDKLYYHASGGHYFEGLNHNFAPVLVGTIYRKPGETTYSITLNSIGVDSSSGVTKNIGISVSRSRAGKYAVTLTNNTPTSVRIHAPVITSSHGDWGGGSCYESPFAYLDHNSTCVFPKLLSAGNTLSFNIICGRIHTQGNWSTGDFTKSDDNSGFICSIYASYSGTTATG